MSIFSTSFNGSCTPILYLARSRGCFLKFSFDEPDGKEVRYQITKSIHRDAFGVERVFLAQCIDKPHAPKIVVKCDDERELGEIEYNFLAYMQDYIGFPKLHGMLGIGPLKCCVMASYGPDLNQLFLARGSKFTTDRIYLILWQALERLRDLHEEGILHRDVKPANFVLGRDTEGHTVIYLIDLAFGKFYNPRGQHIQCNKPQLIIGTSAFLSANGHKGFTLSRRDDLESLCYTGLYFLGGGKLPWDGLEQSDSRMAESKTAVMREATPWIPPLLKEFGEHAMKLQFTERPDYERWIGNFREAEKGCRLQEASPFTG